MLVEGGGGLEFSIVDTNTISCTSS